MFVDASAIVAILTREPEADDLIARLDGAEAPVTSPVAIFEAALGICRQRHASVGEARTGLGHLIAAAQVGVVPIRTKEAETDSTPSRDTAKEKDIRRSSTSATVLPTRSRKNSRSAPCCSKAMILTKQILTDDHRYQEVDMNGPYAVHDTVCSMSYLNAGTK